MKQRLGAYLIGSALMLGSCNYSGVENKIHQESKEVVEVTPGKMPIRYGWGLYIYNENGTLAGINRYPLYKPREDNTVDYSALVISGIGRVVHLRKIKYFNSAGELLDIDEDAYNPDASEALKEKTLHYTKEIMGYFEKRDECIMPNTSVIPNHHECIKKIPSEFVPKSIDDLVFVNIGDVLPKLKKGEHRFVCGCGTPPVDWNESHEKLYEHAPLGWTDECTTDMYCMLEVSDDE